MILYFLILVNLFLNILSIQKYLHVFQLKDYSASRYLEYFKSRFWIILLSNLFAIFFLTSFNIFIQNKNFLLILTIFINLSILISNNIFHFKLIKNKKTPLKYTNKIKRIYIISVILLIFSIFFKYSIIINNLIIIITPIISNFINIYDKIKNNKFILSAQKKIKNSNVKIIAITGSNGKTSVKNILCAMLKKQYKTLAPPKSYNTPLGLSMYINSNLTSETDYIILEYGARRKGDIHKLCKLFGADFGIITTISPQHLSTFHNVENIYNTKKELSEYLLNKPCVFNLDNIYTLRMYLDTKNTEKIDISTNQSTELNAQNIRVENFITFFDIKLHGETYHAHTKLLGRHNITNILLATALAIKLGITKQNILTTIQELQPTEHRLQYIKGHINILDDSYNCSLASAKESLSVLSTSTHKTMVVTPGIIEGGKSQYTINYTLGNMCRFVDYMIIVGKVNKSALADGFGEDNHNKIIFASDLEDAKKYFRLLSKKDTLLLLNDLPDDYS